MTKKYMDFAPVRNTATGGVGVSIAGRAVAPSTKRTSVSSVGRAVAPSTRRTGVTSAGGVHADGGATRVVKKRVVANSGVGRQAQSPRSVSSPRAVSGSKTRIIRAVPKSTTVRATMVPGNARSRGSSGLSMQKKNVKLGEIQDLNSKFVETNVPKRPLSDGSEMPKSSSSATEAKSKRIVGRLRRNRNTTKSNTKLTKTNVVDADAKVSNRKQSVYAVPKTPFINQDKISKRPLSKNVYRSSANTPKMVTQNRAPQATEETVKIISKPKKDSKIGMVVAIILTIILGAVAGTVAFLLLPK